MDLEEFENLIINLLFKNEEARNKLLPHLKPQLFDSFENKELVDSLLKYIDEYSAFPKVAELRIYIKNKKVYERLLKISKITDELDENFLKNEVEDFFKKKLIWDEIYKTTEGLKKDDKGIINSAGERILNSLAFGFDNSIGLDILNEGERVYDFLHQKDNVVSTGVESIDKMIRGGFHEKTLTLLVASTNTGKSLIKCAMATNCLLQNKNVLYITLEMSENMISERILANLFDININDLAFVPKQRFLNKFQQINNKLKSKLVIKEYPTSSINTHKIRSLLKELKSKNNFIPDIVFVDMVDIMLPNRAMKSSNTNTELRTICQELRGLAMETKIPFVSSRQVNREGHDSAEIGLTNVAESIGTTTVADVIFGITQTTELRDARKFCFILLKNRFGINKIKTLVNVNYSKMRISDEVSDESDLNLENSIEIVDKAAVDVLKKINGNKKQERNNIIQMDDDS